MADLGQRFLTNPVVRPANVPASRADLSVICVLNPGAFAFQGKTWLLLRVAEGLSADTGTVSAVILDPTAPGGVRHVQASTNDPAVESGDPRGFRYQGQQYLTTLSHLRLASSTDGVHFEVEPRPAFEGLGDLETYGVEDCRVSCIDGTFYLAYTAVSSDGYGVGMARTTDWQTFTRLGMVLPPPNKDAVLFPERIGGQYVMLHRPVAGEPGGKSMWLARSPDLVHWGEHACLVRSRPDGWDSARVGAGPPPLRIPEGWLEIYHGADAHDRYCLGALLLAADNPARILGRSKEPIMQPREDYELGGFFGNVVFASGATQAGDTLTLYYGAADTIVCGATFSIRAILNSLG